MILFRGFMIISSPFYYYWGGRPFSKNGGMLAYFNGQASLCLFFGHLTREGAYVVPGNVDTATPQGSVVQARFSHRVISSIRAM